MDVFGRFKRAEAPPKVANASNEPRFLSPWRLLQRSYLAGAALMMGLAVMVMDLSCIVLLSYAYGYASAWSKDADLVEQLPGSPLASMSLAILASAFWGGLQLCLTIDICLALCTTSRELQEGTIYSYGIVSAWQIPMTFVCLGFELGPTSREWIMVACTITSFRPSCTDWWSTLRTAAIAPSVIACVLHLLFFLTAFIFIRTRPASSLRPRKPKHKLHKVPDDVEYPYDHSRPNPNVPLTRVPPPPGYSDSDLDSHEEAEGNLAAPLASGGVSRTKVGDGADPPWLLRKGSSSAGRDLEMGAASEGGASRGRSSRGSGGGGAGGAADGFDEPLTRSREASLSDEEEGVSRRS